MNKTRLFVLQPTSFCNLNCRYCYVPDRLNKKRMGFDVLKAAIQSLFRDRVEGEVQFLYHAGEPMTVGRSFYQDVVDLVCEYKPLNLKVTHMLQTNGVLINQEWIDFFKKFDFKIGLSLDGPEFLHDLNRRNWSDRGSFKSVMRGLKLLQQNNIEHGVLTVITSEHLKHPKELMQFYFDEGIKDVGFNVEEVESENIVSSLGDAKTINKDDYRYFMSEVFDFTIKHPEVRVREISDMVHLLYSKMQDSDYITNPLEARDLGLVTIQTNGDISTYCPEFAGMKSEEYNNFVIGNVLDIKRLSDVCNNHNYQQIKKNYDLRKERCKKTCRYYSICGSSCFSNSYSETQDLTQTENISCILQKQELAELILEKLR